MNCPITSCRMRMVISDLLSTVRSTNSVSFACDIFEAHYLGRVGVRQQPRPEVQECCAVKPRVSAIMPSVNNHNTYYMEYSSPAAATFLHRNHAQSREQGGCLPNRWRWGNSLCGYEPDAGQTAYF